MERRGASGIPWDESWGPWPFGDWNNYEFNTQGYQQKYGTGPMGKAWYVRFAGWYKHGQAAPNYWGQTGAGGGGGGTGYLPSTPGIGELATEQTMLNGQSVYVLNYNAYRNEPGYNDAAYMLQILELYARLHG